MLPFLGERPVLLPVVLFSQIEKLTALNVQSCFRLTKELKAVKRCLSAPRGEKLYGLELAVC